MSEDLEYGGAPKGRPQTQYKLEYKLLYSLVVAGKSAKFAENVMAKFLGDPEAVAEQWGTPFPMVRHMCGVPGEQEDVLMANLKYCRSGNYTKLERAFKAIVEAKFNLRTCTPQDLEKVPGIGPKTSRFFILWTRPGAKYAALDTHILKWLRYLGANAPLATPTKKKYALLEHIVLLQAAHRKMTPGELDEKIWRHCQENNNKGLDYSKAGSWPKELR